MIETFEFTKYSLNNGKWAIIDLYFNLKFRNDSTVIFNNQFVVFLKN